MKGKQMRNILFGLIMLGVCGLANAQCVAEVKDVIIDEVRGSIIVETEYVLNGEFVQLGRTRYNEESGDIIVKAKADIKQHCENLIIRNAIKVNGLNEQKLAIQKALTEPLIANLKANAVGWTKTVTQKVIQFKNKEITIEADGSYTITDIIPE